MKCVELPTRCNEFLLVPDFFLQVVIRCLPPTLTEDDLKEILGPLPENDYISFVKADKR